MDYEECKEVTVFGFGDGATYDGIIRGIVDENHYIVEMSYPYHPYSCKMVTKSCIRCRD